jgi:hypothetical protein
MLQFIVPEYTAPSILSSFLVVESAACKYLLLFW